ncbi:bacteriocin immunity protein [Bacillus inaquosorum]|uniref:Bacteriocin immunity protein n=1 Tax=Bacillus inaquosorum TaxID=483913 RepID=A0A9Q4HRN3_9BACI|nr:bacteriocin immunity protein [Bacillus inaquosorum]MCY7787455.1 bacteriocin immunity protein [Bacillus inaquosorum]MCY7821479.1 bacteriocin immunity protein [Bacillus inaquosorum]MCY7937751.1 bacteriocin immunity protein [Bacillus inaquosorum]MCY8084824.1 bacteriocin immunity protein [Bacillus inaquosorum]MCY8170943.1 bacteriocin immunity protein [Bacillus inaquosorum]
MDKPTKEELISLVRELMNPTLDDEKVSEYLALLEKNAPHPAPSDLIFWSNEDYTAEQVVRIALNYKDE